MGRESARRIRRDPLIARRLDFSNLYAAVPDVAEILFSTGNAHKLREASEILGGSFRVLGNDVIPELGEVEETGVTFRENAGIKALAAARLFPGMVLADDSGLEVDALGGEPGVLSARFAGTQGDHEANNRLLLARLSNVPPQLRTARFRCVIALVLREKMLGFFEGVVEGRIATEPRGIGGFGYDPLFLPEGASATFSELSASEKNRCSHRGRALERFREAFLSGEIFSGPSFHESDSLS